MGWPFLDPADELAFRLDSGAAVTADEAEAEIALPPVACLPGFTSRIARQAQAERARLHDHMGKDLRLSGWSTHTTPTATSVPAAQPAPTASPTPVLAADPAQGKLVYVNMGCAGCHDDNAKSGPVAMPAASCRPNCDPTAAGARPHAIVWPRPPERRRHAQPHRLPAEPTVTATG